NVQIRFRLLILRSDSRVHSVQDNVRCRKIIGQSENCSKISDVFGIDLSLAYDRYRLPGAVISARKKGLGVVDRREISRPHSIEISAVVGIRKRKHWLQRVAVGASLHIPPVPRM